MPCHAILSGDPFRLLPCCKFTVEPSVTLYFQAVSVGYVLLFIVVVRQLLVAQVDVDCTYCKDGKYECRQRMED